MIRRLWRFAKAHALAGFVVAALGLVALAVANWRLIAFLIAAALWELQGPYSDRAADSDFQRWAPPRPHNLAPDAKWCGGPDGGTWSEVGRIQDRSIYLALYLDNGSFWGQGWFDPEAPIAPFSRSDIECITYDGTTVYLELRGYTYYFGKRKGPETTLGSENGEEDLRANGV